MRSRCDDRELKHACLLAVVLASEGCSPLAPPRCALRCTSWSRSDRRGIQCLCHRERDGWVTALIGEQFGTPTGLTSSDRRIAKRINDGRGAQFIHHELAP